MAKHVPTTPPRGSNPPVSTEMAGRLAAFDECVAQMHRLQQAEARLDPSGFNTAVFGCEAEAADAHAQADKLIWKFYGSDTCGFWDLSNAAWAMLLLLQSDGLDLHLIAQRSAGLRYRATACARSPLPEEIFSADRLWAAAEVIDLMIEAAIDDYAEIDPDHVEDVRGLVTRGIDAAVERARAQHRRDDPDPDDAPLPCAG